MDRWRRRTVVTVFEFIFRENPNGIEFRSRYLNRSIEEQFS